MPNNNSVPEAPQPEAMVRDTDSSPQSAPPLTPDTGAKKKGLAITGVIIALAGVVLFLIPFVGVLLALVGLVLSIVAIAKKQPKAFSLTGIIAGACGVIGGAIVTAVMFFAMGAVLNAAEACADGAAYVEIAGQTVDCSTVNVSGPTS